MMDVVAYARAHKGDGVTMFFRKLNKGLCAQIDSSALGTEAVIDRIVPNSEFKDSLLGEAEMVQYHLIGKEKIPLWGFIQPSVIDADCPI